jgi:hypothetical protein
MGVEESKFDDVMLRQCIGMEDGPLNLRDMVESVFAPVEMVDFKCDKCNERGGCRRLRRVLSLPKVLIVQINRSYQLEHVRPPFSFKCHRSVTCPDTMEMSGLLRSARSEVMGEVAVVEEEEEEAGGSGKSGGGGGGDDDEEEEGGGSPFEYQLCGLNVHDGGLGGGHNMAYRLDPLTGEWSWFSDQHFGVVSLEEVAMSAPSLAFYVRVGHDEEDAKDGTAMESKEQSKTQKCQGGCGFFGQEDYNWYCSHCARENGIHVSKK